MSSERAFISNALEASIRIGLLVLLAAWCFEIVRPFIIPFAWGIIIAVGTHTLFLYLEERLGNRSKLAATIIVLLGLIILVIPAVMLSDTLVSTAQGLASGLKEGTIVIPPPPQSVKSWPIIGSSLDAFWSQASTNLESALARLAPHLKVIGTWLLSRAAGAGWGLLQFVIAIVIAGALLIHVETGKKAAYAIAVRLAGGKGKEFADLAEATVRSVTRGILGVALIQSILIGLGFVVVGVPGAGLWALLCLILSVVQIGAFPVVVPVLIYVFSTTNTAVAVVFLIWNLFAGSIDNILKPLLLGRGVEVPMVIIFVGAIGGFISSGIIGLFVGAVVLVLGYRLFLAWLESDPSSEAQERNLQTEDAGKITADCKE
jgi:predicted PurR-regulated permease PerM